MDSGMLWVARVNAENASDLAALRLIPNLEIASDPSISSPASSNSTCLWLRGPALQPTLAQSLRKISGLQLFELLPNGVLRKPGNLVPETQLPSLQWQPIEKWALVRMPPASPSATWFTHTPSAKAPLQIVRSSIEQTAHAILTNLAHWETWAASSSQLRLQPLRFAAASNGHVWIEGSPVPSLPGQLFHVHNGIAIPCGFTWQPALDASVLRRWLLLAPDDIAIASIDGSWTVIKAEQFVPASRSAIRRTANAFRHD